MNLIDQLCYQSKLRYENAGQKFAFAICTLLICVFTRSIAVAICVLLVMGILTVQKGGIPLLRYVSMLSVPMGFLIVSTMAVMWHISEKPMDFYLLHLGKWYLTTGYTSLSYGMQLFLTALASVSCLYFLSFTTPMTDILNVLERLHCPRLLVELMLLCYRFIFVLMETAKAIDIAQKCRLGNRSFKISLRSFSMLGSSLMVRAMVRSRRLYDAMEARCYNGTICVLSQNHSVKKKWILAIALYECLLIGIAIFEKRY